MPSPLRTLIVAATLTGITVMGASCGTADRKGSASPTATVAVPTTLGGPLVGPKANTVQDTQYLADLAQADPSLASYVQSQGNTALEALLTDGSAFCAFLQRGGGLDNAMESLAIGANSVESQTHLPLNVTTFNAIDAVSLITLCPAEQKLIPAVDQTKIQSMEKSLGGSS
jgi:hypothetical protein